MKIVLSSLCVNIVFLVVSDAVPLKLVPGDRSVIKKDGATHTILKYYIVPNNFEANKDTNNGKSLKTTPHGTNFRYSKSMDSEKVNQNEDVKASNDKLDGYRATHTISSYDVVPKDFDSNKNTNDGGSSLESTLVGNNIRYSEIMDPEKVYQEEVKPSNDKLDGYRTTHTISKYYIVPNDFEANKDTNDGGKSLKTTLHGTNFRYSKSMDSEKVNQNEDVKASNDKLDGYRATHTISSYDVVPKDFDSSKNTNGGESSLKSTLVGNNIRYFESMDSEKGNQKEDAKASNDKLDRYRATHTISSYGIVPNDFDSNKNTNDGGKSLETTLHGTNFRYSKSMDSEKVNQNEDVKASNDQLDGYRATHSISSYEVVPKDFDSDKNTNDGGASLKSTLVGNNIRYSESMDPEKVYQEKVKPSNDNLDGYRTTHTISKYYIVPNDFEANKDTNEGGKSLKTTPHGTNFRYSKSMDSEKVNQNEDVKASNDKLDGHRATHTISSSDVVPKDFDSNKNSNYGGSSLKSTLVGDNIRKFESMDSEKVYQEEVKPSNDILDEYRATNTISKYYVVRNDFDANKQTNDSKTLLKTSLFGNNIRYSNSMDSDKGNQQKDVKDSDDKLDEYSVTVNNKRSYLDSESNQFQESKMTVDKINAHPETNLTKWTNLTENSYSYEADSNAAATASVNTLISPGVEDLDNLEIEPISKPLNIINNNEDNVYNVYKGNDDENTFETKAQNIAATESVNTLISPSVEALDYLEIEPISKPLNIINKNEDNVYNVSKRNDDENTFDTKAQNIAATASVNTLISPGVESLDEESISNRLNIINNNEDNVNNVYKGNGDENTFETKVQNIEEIDVDVQEILTEFAVAVDESAVRNVNSFWSVFDHYVGAMSDVKEQGLRIDKLFELLNIFTNLQKAILLQIPIDRIIDDIVDILQVNDLKTSRSNSDRYTFQHILGIHLTEPQRECIGKCHELNKKDSLDSVPASLSEGDGRMASDDIEPEHDNPKKYLPRIGNNAEKLDVWVKMPVAGPERSTPIENQPIHIKKSLLINPNLETERTFKTVPGDQTTHSLISAPTYKPVRETMYDMDIRKRRKHIPFANKNKKNKRNLPWFMEQKFADIPWTIEDKFEDLPWVIEDKFINLPWAIQNKLSTAATALHDGSEYTGDITKILLNSNQYPQMVNGVTVKKSLGKPYLHTYAVNPTKFLHSPGISSNIVKIKSGNYDNKLKRVLANSDSNFVVIKEPASGYYGSELTLSEEPSFVDNNKLSNYGSQLNIKKDINLYQTGAGTSPVFYLKNLENHYTSKKMDDNPSIAFPNPLSPESEINLELKKEYSVPTVQKVSSNPEILLLNVPSNSFETFVDAEKNILSPIDDTDVSPEILSTPYPYNTQSHYYDSEVNGQHGEEINILPTILRPNIPSFESDYIKLNKGYNLPTPVYDGDRDLHSRLPNTLNGNQMHFIKRPNLITYSHGNQLPSYNYFVEFKANLAPSYQLFSIENLLKLNDALIWRKGINRLNNIYEQAALANLKKINQILLIVAEHLGGHGGVNKWYENIFLNVRNRQPLQVYVYNLIRQKWLHEIMLLIYRNNFNLNILSNPRLAAFLGSWQIPRHVLKDLEAKGIVEENYETPIAYKQKFAHNLIKENVGSYILKEDLKILEDYETKNVVNDYRQQNKGLNLGTEVDADLNANVVVDILKKYLLYKNYVERQANTISRMYRMELFKKIILFLRDKGYGGRTIFDLIRKLYGLVYTVEGTCGYAQYKDVVRNMYNIIFPVLRRTGQIIRI